MLRKHLWLTILIGMISGILTGLYIPLSETSLNWIELPGRLFIALLTMIIVPLVISSVILGVASAGSLDSFKSMGLRLIPYFIMTTAVAITIGISLTSMINPGESINIDNENSIAIETRTLESLTIPDRIINFIPINPAEAELNKNMLQLVVLGLIIGIALLTIKTSATKTVRDICEFTQNVSMMVVGWAIAFAPIAVFSLMVSAISSTGIEAIQGMGLYVACVIGGLCLILCFYLTLIWAVAHRNPFQFLKDIRTAQIVAFSSSSSAATIPVSLTIAKEKLEIKESIRGFTIPLGATINMDGTALYQATAAIFLCQIFNIDLSLSETILLLITTIGASIGTPGMPGVGLVVLATILTSIGVPPEGIGILLGVDRLLDMCRTTINVTGDLTATAIIQRWMGHKI
jgi:proton glutamate symport protein